MTQARAVGSGRFRLIGPLGEGGMARVYRAIDETTGQEVAVKLLREPFSSDPAIVERFRNEARSAAALQHPNIVRVLEVGDDDGVPYLVLELVAGGDLRDRLRAEGPLPVVDVLEIGQQLCAALAVAHARGIVHRDVKPQNVLIARDQAGDLKVALADFGIARALGAVSQTRTGEILGSVHYLSPEQVRGRPATAQSDLYAVGCVLYELLTGRLPFTAETDIAVAMRHLQDQPTPLGQIRPGTPRMLEEIVMRCLSKDPTMRFGSATELQAALRQVETFSERGTSVVGGPPPATHRPVSAARPPSNVSARTPRSAPSSVAGTAVNVVLLTGLAVILLAVAGVAFMVARTAGQASDPATASPAASASPAVKPTSAVAPTPRPTAQLPPTIAPTASAAPARQVPVVTGQTVEEASATLQRAGLRLKQGETRTDDEVPAGRIIAQSPVPTTEVELGSEVTVVVSRGSSRVEVPRFTGQKLETAGPQAEAAGVTLQPQEVFTSTVPAGTIFGQSPAPGELVTRGAAVTVQVSKGPEMVQVPNVVGLPEEEAKRQILATGKLKLWPYGTNYQGHDTLPDEALRRVAVGAVLSTRPAAGSSVPPGTEVAIAVRKD